MAASIPSMKQLHSLSKTATEFTAHYGWKMYDYIRGGKDDQPDGKYDDYHPK